MLQHGEDNRICSIHPPTAYIRLYGRLQLEALKLEEELPHVTASPYKRLMLLVIGGESRRRRS